MYASGVHTKTHMNVEDISDDSRGDCPYMDPPALLLDDIERFLDTFTPSADGFGELHKRGFCRINRASRTAQTGRVGEVILRFNGCAAQSLRLLEEELPRLFLSHETLYNAIIHVENLTRCAISYGPASRTLLSRALETVTLWPSTGVTSLLSSYLGPHCTPDCIPIVTDCTFNMTERSLAAAKRCQDKLGHLLLHPIEPSTTQPSVRLPIHTQPVVRPSRSPVRFHQYSTFDAPPGH